MAKKAEVKSIEKEKLRGNILVNAHDQDLEQIRANGIAELNPQSYIRDSSVLDFVLKALEIAPLQFFFIPASSSGKYHPRYALGQGGLIRHTRAAIQFAIDLFPVMELDNTDSNEQDYILAALTLHDICKPSKTHPIEVKLALEELREYECYDPIIELIETHMGQWNEYGKLPTPDTPEQYFVHLCDYLASRRNLELILPSNES